MFFRLLLYFIVGYYIFRLISGLFRPKRPQPTGSSHQYKHTRKEGEVVINVDPKSKKGKQISKDDGDYVDYEEV